MSNKKLYLTITTPLRTVYENEVESLTTTTSEGEMTILPGHIPLVVPLKIGHVMVRNEGRQVHYAIDGGILEVRHDNKVVILSDRSEDATEIDIERAEKALQRAEEYLHRKHSDEDIDYARLERDIAKELNRVKIAKKGERR